LPLIQSPPSPSLLPTKQSSNSSSEESELSPSTPTSVGHGQRRYPTRLLSLLSLAVVLFP
jgi:hypothetical protein